MKKNDDEMLIFTGEEKQVIDLKDDLVYDLIEKKQKI